MPETGSWAILGRSRGATQTTQDSRPQTKAVGFPALWVGFSLARLPARAGVMLDERRLGVCGTVLQYVERRKWWLPCS